MPDGTPPRTGAGAPVVHPAYNPAAPQKRHDGVPPACPCTGQHPPFHLQVAPCRRGVVCGNARPVSGSDARPPLIRGETSTVALNEPFGPPFALTRSRPERIA